VTHPPANPEPIEVIARELHELMRLSNPGCPAWEDLDPDNVLQAKLIQMAREAARKFIPADGAAPDPQTPS
jgi:hypothetical protein